MPPCRMEPDFIEVEVLPGDLIYSGAPAGVGPTIRGDKLVGGVEGVGELEITVV